MSHVARRHSLLPVVLILLAGCLTVSFVVLHRNSDQVVVAHGSGGADVQRGAGSFTISGNTTKPISPGVGVPLDLTITNPHGFAISVSRLNVKVGSVNAPKSTPSHPCGITDFTVAQAPAELEISVGAGQTGTLHDFDIALAAWPHVAMLNRPVNQDGCQGATLTLDYAATGTRES